MNAVLASPLFAEKHQMCWVGPDEILDETNFPLSVFYPPCFVPGVFGRCERVYRRSPCACPGKQTGPSADVSQPLFLRHWSKFPGKNVYSSFLLKRGKAPKAATPRHIAGLSQSFIGHNSRFIV